MAKCNGKLQIDYELLDMALEVATSDRNLGAHLSNAIKAIKRVGDCEGYSDDRVKAYYVIKQITAGFGGHVEGLKDFKAS